MLYHYLLLSPKLFSPVLWNYITQNEIRTEAKENIFQTVTDSNVHVKTMKENLKLVDFC